MADVRTTRFELDGFRGRLLHPGDDGYDEARTVFNGMIDRRPARHRPLRAVPTTSSPSCGSRRGRGLPLSVYGGGHGVTGSAVCDGGRRASTCAGMKGVDGRPAARDGPRRGRRSRGARSTPRPRSTGSPSPAAACRPPASPGSRSAAAAAGSSASFGFVCDNLIAAEVVTADGRQVVASEDENAGALLGAARRRRQLRHRHRVPLPAAPARADRVRRDADVPGRDGRRRSCASTATSCRPRPTRWAAAWRSSPRRPRTSCPSRCAASRSIGVVVLLRRPGRGRAEEAFRPLREFGPPGIDMIGPMPYVAVQQLLDAPNPQGHAELLDRRLPRRAARRGDRRARRARDASRSRR